MVFASNGNRFMLAMFDFTPLGSTCTGSISQLGSTRSVKLGILERVQNVFTGGRQCGGYIVMFSFFTGANEMASLL